MKNKTANLCKFTAKLIGGIGLIICVLIAFNMITVIRLGSFTFPIVFLISYSGIFLFSLLIYAVGEALQLLQEIRDKVPGNKSTASVQCRNSTLAESTAFLHSKNDRTQNFWTCPTCQKINPIQANSCMECGTTK